MTDRFTAPIVYFLPAPNLMLELASLREYLSLLPVPGLPNLV
jgi:hypothetical protein